MTRDDLIEFKEEMFRRIRGATLAMTDLPSIGATDFMAIAAMCQIHRAACQELEFLQERELYAEAVHTVQHLSSIFNQPLHSGQARFDAIEEARSIIRGLIVEGGEA